MRSKKMIFSLIVFLTVLSYANAQGPGFDNDVVDAPNAPIPGLFIAAVAGILIGARKVCSKK